MKTIPLTQGLVALVSDEDYENLRQYKWHASVRKDGSVYVRRWSPRPNRKPIYMHQEILGHKWIDHVDRNGLNNQRENLRPTTYSLNGHNTGKPKRKNPTSIFKGVHWCRTKEKWIAKVSIRGKHAYLGSFDTPRQAALAYQRATKRIQQL